mgnify:CR=1 FL=1
MYDNDQNYGWKSYDNQSYDNRQYGGDPYGRVPAGGYAPKEEKRRHFKKTAMITAGALLFGTVSGAAMVGVNVAASRFTGNSSAASAEPEKKEDIPKARTESRDSGQDNGQGSASQGDGGYQQGQRNNGKAVADVSDIVEQAMPTVVAITSTAVYQSNNYGYGWFFRGGPQTYEVPSSGSGIIIGENDKGTSHRDQQPCGGGFHLPEGGLY